MYYTKIFERGLCFSFIFVVVFIYVGGFDVVCIMSTGYV